MRKQYIMKKEKRGPLDENLRNTNLERVDGWGIDGAREVRGEPGQWYFGNH